VSSPAFRRALQQIGSGVVDGTLPAGSRTSVEALVEATLASRSIVREATRVLAALGMLTASPRIGLVVRPREDWNLLDPQVVDWRLAGPDRAAQLSELLELRAAVEPAAAQWAAHRSGDADRQRFAELGDLLERADRRSFAALDRDLHGLVLRASGNPMFVNLGGVVDRAVHERATVDPDPVDVDLHATLARAVADGRPAEAAEVMHRIVVRTSRQ
jgi:DNA-binding FadR family transcriptional regulator